MHRKFLGHIVFKTVKFQILFHENNNNIFRNERVHFLLNVTFNTWNSFLLFFSFLHVEKILCYCRRNFLYLSCSIYRTSFQFWKLLFQSQWAIYHFDSVDFKLLRKIILFFTTNELSLKLCEGREKRDKLSIVVLLTRVKESNCYLHLFFNIANVKRKTRQYHFLS